MRTGTYIVAIYMRSIRPIEMVPDDREDRASSARNVANLLLGKYGAENKMKRKQVTSKLSGFVLKGASAQCHDAVWKLRTAEREAYEARKEEVKRKRAELRTAADVKAADEYEIAAERKVAAAKYRAETREKAKKYEWELHRKASNTSGKLYKKSLVAAERKVNELLLEAIDTQIEPNGHLGVYLRELRLILSQQLRHIGAY